MKKMLITCGAMLPKKCLETLRKIFNVTEETCSLGEENLKEMIKSIDVAVIGGNEFYTLDVIKAAKPSIRFIFLGVQGDTSFSPEAFAYHGRKKRILLTGGGLAEVARATVAEISDPFLRKMLITQKSRNFQWTSAEEAAREFRPLSDLEVSVIGAGGIGSQVLAMLDGKTDRLKYYARSKKISSENIRWEHDLEKAFEADFVTIHLPLTRETEGIITKKHLSRIRKGGWLINNARSALIGEEDLIAYAQNNGKAIVDVYPREGVAFEALAKDKNNPLAQIISLPNFILTSHTAAFSSETFEEYGQGLMKIIAENKLDLD